MHIKCKINFIQDSSQRFSLHFKSIFLRVYCIAQKMYISQELAKLVCAFSSKTLYAMDKTRPSKCKFPDLQLFAWNLIKFLVSFFKLRVSFPLSFASPLSAMTYKSYEIFSLKHYMLGQKQLSKVQFFSPLMKVQPIFLAIFETTRSGFI